MEQPQQLVQREQESVCVVGLGTVGQPTAEYFISRKVPTYGCDLNPSALERLKPSLHGASTSLAALPLADVFIVTVDTGLHGDSPSTENVFRACEAIAKRGRPKLVSIESTVPVGTCRRLHEEIFAGDQPLVHVPHRWWMEETRTHGVRQVRVIGGIDEASLEVALPFYGRAGIPLIPVTDIRLAELCKIAENTDRYLKIAYAELLKLVCDENRLDFEQLRQAMNTKWNVEVLEARDGIGGTCLPKDILYVKAAAPEVCHLLDGARAVDRLYRESKEKVE
jgi:UDP-N-acetyl-D-mannosaminuronic acid dehydrogenase